MEIGRFEIGRFEILRSGDLRLEIGRLGDFVRPLQSLLLFLILLLPGVAYPGDAPLSGELTAYPVVIPETTTRVVMSSSDVNRLVCRAPIKDVVFSKEKGVTVKTIDNNAFVKFLIRVEDGKDVYSTTPSELFIVCGGEVYSIIAIPQRVPAQTVILSSGHKERIRKNMALFKGMPFEKKILFLIKSLYRDDIPDSFTVDNYNRRFSIFLELNLTLRRIVTVEGEGLRIKEYIVERASSDSSSPLQLSEKQFLRVELTKAPVAIALEKLNLSKGDVTRLFIVERFLEF